MHRCLRVRRIALFGVWFLYSVAILGMSDHTTTFQYRASSTMGILPPTIQSLFFSHHFKSNKKPPNHKLFNFQGSSLSWTKPN